MIVISGLNIMDLYCLLTILVWVNINLKWWIKGPFSLFCKHLFDIIQSFLVWNWRLDCTSWRILCLSSKYLYNKSVNGMKRWKIVFQTNVVHLCTHLITRICRGILLWNKIIIYETGICAFLVENTMFVDNCVMS